MRHQRVLGVHPRSHLVHTSLVRYYSCLVLGHTIVELNHLAFVTLLDVKLMLAIDRREDHFNPDVLRSEIANVQNHLNLKAVMHRKIVGGIRLSLGNHLNVLPLATNHLLPSGDLPGKAEVIGYDLFSPLGLRDKILVAIVSQHPVGGEVAGHLGYCVLDIANPLG